MADGMDSDTCLVSKGGVTEMEETVFPLHHEQELSNYVSMRSVPEEDSKDSSLIASSPKEDQEIPSPTSFEKVKCSFSEKNQGMLSAAGKEKVILCDLFSGSFGCERSRGDFARKAKTLDLQVQEMKNSVVCFVSNVEKRQEEIEGTVANVKGQKSEVGSSEVEEFDKHGVYVSGECKDIDFERGSVIEEIKDFLIKENLLEAKKKQLLAELEAGSIFKDKVHLKNVLGFNTAAGILVGLKETNESATRSLNAEVIDGTLLIETVPFPRTGKACVKIANGNVHKNEKQEIDGKKAKRLRKKGKERKKVLEINEQRNVDEDISIIIQVGVAQSGDHKNRDRFRKYTREEMEALRFMNILEQRKLWTVIHTGLGDAVVQEYDDLASSRHQKNIRFNFDPRHHCGRKEGAPGILREVSSENGDIELEKTEDEVENVNLLGPACSESIGAEDSNTVLKGECNEEEDSDEDYVGIQRPAFLVEGEPDFDSGPPEDGLEYLRHVRWEAAHIPKVTVAKCDRSKVNKDQSVYMPQIPEIAKCPENLVPLKQWEDAFLADFSELRMFLSRNESSSCGISCKLQSTAIGVKQNTSSPQLTESIILEKFNNVCTDEVGSYEFDDSCPGNTIDQSSVASVQESKLLACSQNTSHSNISDSSLNYPTLCEISAMDSVARVSMLRKRISLAENMSALSKNDGVWLFALCAAVDSPLDADTCAALRTLLRKCASLRSAKSELDDEVIMLNILATISGRYFGQADH